MNTQIGYSSLERRMKAVRENGRASTLAQCGDKGKEEFLAPERDKWRVHRTPQQQHVSTNRSCRRIRHGRVECVRPTMTSGGFLAIASTQDWNVTWDHAASLDHSCRQSSTMLPPNTCTRTAVTSRGLPKSSVTHSLVLLEASHNVVRSPSADNEALLVLPLEEFSTTTEALSLTTRDAREREAEETRCCCSNLRFSCAQFDSDLSGVARSPSNVYPRKRGMRSPCHRVVTCDHKNARQDHSHINCLPRSGRTVSTTRWAF